jgi:hypothetical protein
MVSAFLATPVKIGSDPVIMYYAPVRLPTSLGRWLQRWPLKHTTNFSPMSDCTPLAILHSTIDDFH